MYEIIFVFFIMFLLTGCVSNVSMNNIETQSDTYQFESSDEPSTSDNIETIYVEKETLIPDSELNVMQRILLNMENVMVAVSNRVSRIEQVCNDYALEVNGELYYGRYFWCYDFNNDGAKEVIVESTYKDQHMILYDIDGNIYCYITVAADEYYENGMVTGREGMLGWLFRIEQFTSKGMECEGILSIYYGDEGIVYSKGDNEYWKPGIREKLSKEKGEEILNIYTSGTPVTKYDFTRENIETILGNWGDNRVR